MNFPGKIEIKEKNKVIPVSQITKVPATTYNYQSNVPPTTGVADSSLAKDRDKIILRVIESAMGVTEDLESVVRALEKDQYVMASERIKDIFKKMIKICRLSAISEDSCAALVHVADVMTISREALNSLHNPREAGQIEND